MNAMTVAKTEFSDHVHVILTGDSEMDPQFAGVDAHIAHINQGIGDIKTEQRRIDDKFDKKFDDMTPRLEVLRDKIETSTAAVSKRIDDTHASLTERLEDAGERLESVRKEVTAAGFHLVEEGNFLRNPADPRDWNSSPGASGEKRGTSDRFCLAFAKP